MLKIEDKNVYLLFKRGQSKHIKALYEHGEIYMSSVDFIRNADENTERTDKHDGFAFREYIGKTKLTIAKTAEDLEKNGLTFDTENTYIVYDEEIKGNIYCLTGIYSEELSGERNDIVLDTHAFGEDLIEIKHPKIFLQRVMDGLRELGYKNIIHEKVTYYDNNYSGELGFFKKHEKFKGQNEFRIFVPNKNNEPIKLNIGSIRDIASISKNGFLEVHYGDGKIQNITY